jgi:hypothetical protein
MNETNVSCEKNEKIDMTPLGAPVPTFPNTLEQTEYANCKKRRAGNSCLDACCHSSK